MKTSSSIFGIAAVCATFLLSCEKDDTNSGNNASTSDYSQGVYITNEGPFSTGTGTISHFDPVGKKLSNDLFQSVNGRPLGNVVQSMSAYGSRGYIVVNNAGKVEVVDLKDFKQQGSISGLNMPRYFLGLSSSKAYVTEWGTDGTGGSVCVIDLSTLSVTRRIEAGKGPEAMLKKGNYVYVVNSGGFGHDSTLSVIDMEKDSVVKTLVIGHYPNSIQEDANGKLWVLCGGTPSWYADPMGDPASLATVDPSDDSVTDTLLFSSAANPSKLMVNATGDKLYYIYNGNIYEKSVSSDDLGSILVSRSFYGMGLDKANAVIYAADPKDYSSNGWVVRYSASNGALIDSFQVGIIPGNFEFK